MKLTSPHRFWTVILSLIVIVACTYLIATGIYGVDLQPRAVLYQLLDPPGHEHVGVSKQFIVEELEIIHNQLTKAFHLKELPNALVLQRISQLIRRINPEYGMDTLKSNETLVNVCAERYMGPKYGLRDYFASGWIMDDCINVRSLKSVISIVLYFKSCNDSNDKCTCNHINNTLNGMKEHYPLVPVHIAVFGESCKPVIQQYEALASLMIISTDSKLSDGQIWMVLIKNVNTPYVLIGRDLYHFWNFSRLERQISIIDSVPNVKVVGGAFRNLSRHWQVGCHQAEMINYVLKYREGYFISRNECMFCDHLSGPFVALTNVFKEIPLDTKLTSAVVFLDFFLRLREHQIHVMTCPDVMYYASPSVDDRSVWIPFAKKWSINDIYLSNDITFTFTCDEAGLSCENLKILTRFYLMPKCCVLEFKKAVAFLRDFCNNNSIHYEFTAGSVLGAVKMNDFIPWDLDGDALYYTSNHSVFLNAKEYFLNHGFSLSNIENPVCCNEKNNYKNTGYVQFNTPQMYVEMWGELQMADEVLPPPDLKGSHTLINIHGEWVNGPPNPGLYARNRYGAEILKHAQSWIHVGKKSSWEEYEAGHFKPCPKHNFHACLDRFPTDGSLIFNPL